MGELILSNATSPLTNSDYYWWTNDYELPMEKLISYAQENASVSALITDILAFVVCTCSLCAIAMSILLIYAFCTKNRHSLSADYAYLIIYFSILALALVGLSYLV